MFASKIGNALFIFIYLLYRHGVWLEIYRVGLLLFKLSSHMRHSEFSQYFECRLY